METMYFGPVALTQAVLPGIRARGSGAVVQISSMGGQVTMPGFGAYCSAKFALEALSESLAAEVEPLGIRVLIVEPGAFRTAFGGRGMHRSRRIDAYEPTVGPTRTGVDSMDGSQPGDPRKAADAIVAALDALAAPLHLPWAPTQSSRFGSPRTGAGPTSTPGKPSAARPMSTRRPSDRPAAVRSVAGRRRVMPGRVSAIRSTTSVRGAGAAVRMATQRFLTAAPRDWSGWL
jgi:hypothetical protein